MQKMIGVRYRDLIESADKIVNMHSAALRLETSLKEMPEEWKRLDSSLRNALISSPPIAQKRASLTAQAEPVASEQKSEVPGTLSEQIMFLLRTPEKIWQCLDRGDSFEALTIYGQAKDIYENPAVQKGGKENYPFLVSQWDCIQNFQWVSKQQNLLRWRIE